MINSSNSFRTTNNKKISKRRQVKNRCVKLTSQRWPTLLWNKFDSLSGDLTRWNFMWLDWKGNQVLETTAHQQQGQRSFLSRWTTDLSWVLGRPSKFKRKNRRRVVGAESGLVSERNDPLGTIWVGSLESECLTLMVDIRYRISKSANWNYWTGKGRRKKHLKG